MRKNRKNICADRERTRLWAVLVIMLLLAGCTSTSEEEFEKLVPVTPPIDLSGVWGGTWSGNDPTVGPISGNWEADLTQSDTAVSGSGSLSGDIDCADGPMSGSLNKQYVISGNFIRDPCGTNEWVITALSLLNREASGMWTKPSVSAEGTFSGRQLATPTGPRIKYFYPPGGLPGTVVSVTGDRFAADPANNVLNFNGTPVPAMQVRDSQRIIANVPSGATIGPLTMSSTTGGASETGHSVLSFNPNVTHPTPESINSTIDTACGWPRDIAITPNGRRAFVTHASYQCVSMIDVATSTTLDANRFNLGSDPQAVVVSPDSKFAYVSTGIEVVVLHAGLNDIIDRIPISGGNTSANNPDGLAITPDGRNLLVSDNRPGGAVSVINIEDHSLPGSLSFPSATPSGIVVSPDGLFAYIAFQGLSQVKEFSLDTYSVTNTIDVGINPTGLAILPDGSKLYVANSGTENVSVIDLATGSVTNILIGGGGGPVDVDTSPDGLRVYSANYTSGTISIIDTGNDTVVGTLSVAFSALVSVSVLPDGLRGYVADRNTNIVQIGGPSTLTILKSGGGGGYVSSSPGGIDCGSKCRAEFPGGSNVTLTAATSGYSRFDGWSGDCSGTSNSVTVTMDSLKNCTASFSSTYSGGTTYYSGGSYYYCFIATAAYGSYLNPKVQVLRDFRDKYLLNNSAGRAFVEWYYENSPPLAEYISRHDGLRLVARLVLTPLVYGAMYPVAALILLMMFIIVLLWRRQINKLNNRQETTFCG